MDPKAEMSYHLCYGDFAHQYFVQPPDTKLSVELANAIIESVSPVYPIASVQMLIPKGRVDRRSLLQSVEESEVVEDQIVLRRGSSE